MPGGDSETVTNERTDGRTDGRSDGRKEGRKEGRNWAATDGSSPEHAIITESCIGIINAHNSWAKERKLCLLLLYVIITVYVACGTLILCLTIRGLLVAISGLGRKDSNDRSRNQEEPTWRIFQRSRYPAWREVFVPSKPHFAVYCIGWVLTIYFTVVHGLLASRGRDWRHWESPEKPIVLRGASPMTTHQAIHTGQIPACIWLQLDPSCLSACYWIFLVDI